MCGKFALHVEDNAQITRFIDELDQLKVAMSCCHLEVPENSI